MAPIPIILDMDPGHDDAVAIMLACGSPGLEVRAISTVAGNATLENTTRNALKILGLIGRGDIPVAAGAAAPLRRPLATAADIHGESGMDGPEIPDPDFGPDERGAVQLIADTIEASAEPVTLVPTGPLTNIAAFLSEHEDLKENISRVVLMGGSMGLGNTTPAAEFNIFVDPEAAQAVFDSGLPVTMVGLDVTHDADAGPEEVARMRELGRVGEVAAELVTFFTGTYERVFGFPEPPIHDAVAVAAVLEPGILQTRRIRVDVEQESKLTRGETVCDLYGVTGKEPNAEVAVGLDRGRFFGILFEALERL